MAGCQPKYRPNFEIYLQLCTIAQDDFITLKGKTQTRYQKIF